MDVLDVFVRKEYYLTARTVRQLLCDANLTHSEFAELIGVHRVTISNICRGPADAKHAFTLDQILAMKIAAKVEQVRYEQKL